MLIFTILKYITTSISQQEVGQKWRNKNGEGLVEGREGEIEDDLWEGFGVLEVLNGGVAMRKLQMTIAVPK